MATQYVCDRCGKKMTHEEHMNSMMQVRYRKSYSAMAWESTWRDLCEKCATEFENWYEQKESKEKKIFIVTVTEGCYSYRPEPEHGNSSPRIRKVFYNEERAKEFTDEHKEKMSELYGIEMKPLDYDYGYGLETAWENNEYRWCIIRCKAYEIEDC